MKTLLLVLFMSSAASLAWSQTPILDRHGWKVVYVGYSDEADGTSTTDKQYGIPYATFFAQKVPTTEDGGYPKLLTFEMLAPATVTPQDLGPNIRTSLEEYDCARRLYRSVEIVMTDDTKTVMRGLNRLRWLDVPERSPAEAYLKYACDPPVTLTTDNR